MKTAGTFYFNGDFIEVIEDSGHIIQRITQTNANGSISQVLVRGYTANAGWSVARRLDLNY